MADPNNWVVYIYWLDENGDQQWSSRGSNTRTDVIEFVNEVLNDASYYPEGTTFQKVIFCEKGVAP